MLNNLPTWKSPKKYSGALELYSQLWLAINEHLPGHIAEIMQERDDSSLEGKREGKRAERGRESVSAYLSNHSYAKQDDWLRRHMQECVYVYV